MTHPDQHRQSGRAVILAVLLGVLITLGCGVALMAVALIPETPERQSSLGAGDSGPGGPILPSPPARAAT